jgi:hypothetical protein
MPISLSSASESHYAPGFLVPPVDALAGAGAEESDPEPAVGAGDDGNDHRDVDAAAGAAAPAASGLRPMDAER